ncbi:DmsE family decaheme c-type cytochrome [Silvibacterium bohemicum]|uniref:DmsE family decaheme c-type cytochrome n=1 Tax=Silvibacterium bohemicum TaxID=1577686 RepID=A0A841JVT3_9BACT|nr:DmsE family decaheme c-type cytochrome [Silvibacterium bohemicum]MBB6143849.1 DmsE family decaheme c-type cytochrome [Silvibacterium bohemicum]
MKRVLFCVALIALLPGLWKTGWVNAASGSGQQGTTAQNPTSTSAPASSYVGSDTCMTCHADVAKSFPTNPHSRLALMHDGKGVTCESCHGPGLAHVSSGGDVTKIFRFGAASTKEIDATCLGCHAGAHPNFNRSPHAKAGLSCLSCHSIHGVENEASLLKVSQPTLCYTCHTDVKGAFAMPFHHPVDEGTVKCSDCHDVHGTFGRNNLKSTVDQNRICTKCHVETRGPFVYEHAAVKAVGCLGCHTPHGSQNARLLNMPSINTLCNQCHSPVAGGTFHTMNAGSSELTPCTSCHTMIHGSNLNQAFLK